MPKSNIRFVLLLGLGILTSFTAQAASTEYYRHLVFRESPFEPIRGNYPVSAEQVKNKLHFRILKDKEGRITEVSHRVGDTVVADNGSWDSFLWFGPMTRINYAPGKEVRSFYDRKGERISVHGQVYRMEFDLDEKGLRKSLQFFDKEGKAVNSEWNIQRYQWEVVKPGTVIEQRFDLNNKPATMRPNLLFSRVRMEFGGDDLLDFVYHIDEKGELINNATGAAVDRIVYDINENFSRWQVYDKDLRPVNGNDPRVAVGEHLYDSEGNKIALRGFDVDGKDRTFSWGVRKDVNRYDAIGNLTASLSYRDDGKLMSEIRFSYSADGIRREWIRFFDASGAPDMSRGFSSIQVLYDSQGFVVGSKRFDNALNEVKG